MKRINFDDFRYNGRYAFGEKEYSVLPQCLVPEYLTTSYVFIETIFRL